MKGKEETIWLQRTAQKVPPSATVVVPPESKSAAWMLSYNEPRVQALPTTSSEEREVVRYFDHILDKFYQHEWGATIQDMPYLCRAGGRSTSGVIPVDVCSRKSRS